MQNVVFFLHVTILPYSTLIYDSWYGTVIPCEIEANLGHFQEITIFTKFQA